MFFWIPYPFIRFLLFFGLGILAHSLYPAYLRIAYVLFAASVMAYVVSYVLFRQKSISRYTPYTPSFGIYAFVILFLGGYLRAYLSTEKNWSGHITQLNEKVSYYAGEVIEPLKENEKRFSTTLSVSYVNIEGMWQPASGKVKLNSSKSTGRALPALGDLIMIHGSAHPIRQSMNPGVFDYRTYLEGQNIYMTDFVGEEEWIVYGEKAKKSLTDYAFMAQTACANIIRAHIEDPLAEGIVLALVLGLKTGLDDSLQEAYATAGVMHILAVSGLHVGIIYAILLFSLSWLKQSRWLFAIACLLVLWAFAFITGLSPSVMRAVTMFSFIIIAKAWDRQTNIYNTIAASAFFLLLINPYFLQSVGFQLSYLAVLGIVFLFPKLYPLIRFDSKFVDEVWKLMCVSFAAQLAVFPISTYYFNQFPMYFLLANIVLVPSAFVMLSLGIALLATSFVASLASLIGTALNFVVTWLNHFVFWISYLPLSRVSGLYISGWQTFILMVLLLAIIMFFYYKNIRWMFLIMALCLAFQYNTFQRFWSKQDRVMTYYSINQRGVLSFSEGSFFALENTGGKWIDEKIFNYTIQPGLLRSGRNVMYKQIEDDKSSALHKADFPYGRIWVWNGYKIMTLDNIGEYNWDFQEKVEVDVLILENEAVKTWDDIPGNLYFKYLMIGNTYKYWTADRLLKEAEEEKAQVFHPLTSGAFVLNLKRK